MNKVEAAILSFLSRAAQGGVTMPPHLLKEFAEGCQKALEKHFGKEKEDFRLRMSNVGKPLCQLQMQSKNAESEKPTYDFKMRMIMGDVLESLIITIIKASGLKVKNTHKKVEYKLDKKNSISGEFDIELSDGIYDIKTVSPFAFEHKFKHDDAYERIKEADSFGYVAQGHGYAMAAKRPFKGWIALNKSTGEITVAEAKNTKKEKDYVHDKLRTAFKSLHGKRAFERCFSDVEEVFYKKATGNRTLGIECSYCPFKHSCWKKLEFKRQLPSKGRNPKWVWYTHITKEWRDADNSV
tara:strand:+ start:52 stop:939 length:888 start_codon:yes stop_codon:yes gene_type:complete